MFWRIINSAAQVSREDSQYSLLFLLASRISVNYIADEAKEVKFDERYDAALRNSELAHLVVGPSLALDIAPDLAAAAATMLPSTVAVGQDSCGSRRKAIGTLERLVRLAEKGAYVGAAVQPIAGRRPNGMPEIADRSLLAVACHYYFIELCLSESAADEEPNDGLLQVVGGAPTDSGAIADTSKSLMARLLELDADAAGCRDAGLRLPLHHLCMMAALMTSECPASACLRQVRARCLRGAVACARQLLHAFPTAATCRDTDEHTPLSCLLFSDLRMLDAHHFYDDAKNTGRERRCIYRPLVALLVNTAPASLSTSTVKGRLPFDMLKRMMVPNGCHPRNGNFTAVTSQDCASSPSPVDAFVTRVGGIGTTGNQDKTLTCTLLKPSTIELFREVQPAISMSLVCDPFIERPWISGPH